MPQTLHVERHFRASNTIRDIVIGMADGLTLPFALAAGLSGAVASSHLITTAGIAEPNDRLWGAQTQRSLHHFHFPLEK